VRERRRDEGDDQVIAGFRGRRTHPPRWLVLALSAVGALTASAIVRFPEGTALPAPTVPDRREPAKRATDSLDALDLADRRHRAAHDVRLVRGRPTAGFAVFGRLRLRLDGVALDPGGVLYARLSAARVGRSALAITLATPPEHHGKAQTWAVEVDGREVCDVTEADPGAGTARTGFVELDSTATVTVRLRAGWRNAFPIVVSSLRTFSMPDDPGPPEARDADYRMGLTLLTSRGYGFALDRAEVERIRSLIPASPYATPQAAVLYSFCRADMDAQLRAMRAFCDLAHGTRFPIRVAPQMHWAGIPAGVADGAGGTFGDVPYQQITWDAADATEDPGLRPLMGDRYDVRYGLSVPNRWSNTPWLTFNHPRLNQYRRSRLRQCVAAWVTVRERLARWGMPHLFPGELSTGEETVYWAKGVDDTAYTEANGGKPRTALLADFNPFVVADAMADRIILDPRNGLDRNERWWLHQNLSRWQQTIVDWILEALPPEPIRLTPDAGDPTIEGPVRVAMAEDTVRRNVYTEPYAMPVFPMRGVNPLRPGLELGYVRDARSGGEYWSGATMLPWLIKERELGRIALPNLECTGADDGQLVACLSAAYAHGARYATLYNWHHRSNVRALLEAFVGSIETPRGPAWAPVAPSAAPPSGPAPTTERTYVAGPGAFGVNVITAQLVASSGDAGVARIGIRTLDARPERRVAVLAPIPAHSGPGGATSRAVTVTVRLPAMFPQQPGAHYGVSVDAGAGAGPAPAADGMPAVSLVSDLRLERWRSMAVADLQDARDIIESVARGERASRGNSHSAEWLADATRLLKEGRPRSAYSAAIKAEQLQFPCAFAVAEPGARLVPFPIEVLCPGERVHVTITALTPAAVSLIVRATARHRVTLRYRGRTTTVELAPDTPVAVVVEAAR
jgi:hypothetical protein